MYNLAHRNNTNKMLNKPTAYPRYSKMIYGGSFIKSTLLIAVLIIGILYVGPERANADSSSQRVTMTPFLQSVVVPADQPTKSFLVTLTNNASFTQHFLLDTVDFGNLDDTGGLVYSGADSKALNKKYGLANWLELSQREIILDAGKSVEIEAIVKNDVELTPGGHYAAIIAQVDSDRTQLENTIQINQKISSLVFVTKTGGEAYRLALKGFTHNATLLHLPNRVILDFENKGNVHVIPRGVVSLKNLSGEVISKEIINEASSYVLPETSRQFAVDMKKTAKGIVLPGKYRIEIAYRYDGYETMAVKTKTVMFISWMVVAIVFILLGAMYYIFQRTRTKKHFKKSRK